LDLIFHEEAYSNAMARLHNLGLLEAIHTDLVWDEWLADKVRAAKAFSLPLDWGTLEFPDLNHIIYGLWLLRLEPKQIALISKRLRFTGALKADIIDAQRLCEFLCELPEGLKVSEVVQRLEDSRERSLITTYFALEEGSEAKQAVVNYLTRWRKIQPVTTGDDLSERGLPPGPRYREILWRLRAAWLDGEIKDSEGETEMLETLLRDSEANA
jgi:tRNA nucleotidyltransferase (CCA-adding enzyme)